MLFLFHKKSNRSYLHTDQLCQCRSSFIDLPTKYQYFFEELRLQIIKTLPYHSHGLVSSCAKIHSNCLVYHKAKQMTLQEKVPHIWDITSNFEKKICSIISVSHMECLSMIDVEITYAIHYYHFRFSTYSFGRRHA